LLYLNIRPFEVFVPVFISKYKGKYLNFPVLVDAQFREKYKKYKIKPDSKIKKKQTTNKPKKPQTQLPLNIDTVIISGSPRGMSQQPSHTTITEIQEEVPMALLLSHAVCFS